MKNLFAYGTLMCGDIMYAVTGRKPPSRPGVLSAFRRSRIRGEHYPALVPEAEATVDGIVYHDIPEYLWHRLDRFEGEQYERRRIEVMLDDGTRLACETYVFRLSCRQLLEPGEWDYPAFLEHDRAAFLEEYSGFDILNYRRSMVKRRKPLTGRMSSNTVASKYGGR